MITSKVEGREVAAPEQPEVGGAQLADLMAMLEASVRAATAAKPVAMKAAGAAKKATSAKPAPGKATEAAKPAAAKPAATKVPPAGRAAGGRARAAEDEAPNVLRRRSA
jgi:hypothetical protein